MNRAHNFPFKELCKIISEILLVLNTNSQLSPRTCSLVVFLHRVAYAPKESKLDNNLVLRLLNDNLLKHEYEKILASLPLRSYGIFKH
ncbi:hypothetical protein BpHYR1_046691 [Brachionus plicatilis]|uniref:Uncharacterized protein n=1 Tax=Brachionus plicatilis TaxID=10195 RepID=A0A3M7RW26_BRAPC|nr:hypothetical protein BpHYR1_046691 [Brachionus plicatilis]